MINLKAILSLLLILASGTVMPASDNPPIRAASPVLVELFTSEGCSSCPPADALLEALDRTQPVPGVQAIVLSEHVDYWNHLGWSDPYSSAFFSDRQSSYARQFGLDSAYTPQMVVDGKFEFTGSDSEHASQAIAKARTQPKVSVLISSPSLKSPATLSVHLEADSLPNAQENAEVYLAVALNHAESQVSGGENGGRRLSHVAVVQSLTEIGTLKNGKGLSRDVEIKLNPHTDTTNLRVIAFVQQTGPGQVLGAAMRQLGK